VISLRSCGRSAVVPVIFSRNTFAAGCLELRKLAGVVLGVGRDAGIAVNHPCIAGRRGASPPSSAAMLSNNFSMSPDSRP
jgi:hypothetical protein